jgi:hypothetical protein
MTVDWAKIIPKKPDAVPPAKPVPIEPPKRKGGFKPLTLEEVNYYLSLSKRKD